jgi:hypothetical protein
VSNGTPGTTTISYFASWDSVNNLLEDFEENAQALKIINKDKKINLALEIFYSFWFA